MHAPARVTVIAFDLGGVLANDVWEHALLDASRGIAITYRVDPLAAREAASRIWTEFACTAPQHGWQAQEHDYWSRCIEVLRLPADVHELIATTEQFIQPLPGMLELVDQVRARVKVVLCSNNTEFWYQREAAKFGLERRFATDDVFLSCRIGSEKGHPDQRLFQAMVDRLGVGPQQILLVDDRQTNIEAATQLGMLGILFPSHALWGSKYLTRLLDHITG